MKIIAVVAMVLGVAHASAKQIEIDASIRHFLESGAAESIRVLLTYRGNTEFSLSPSTVAKAVRRTREHEAAVFDGSIALAERQTLWLLNGTIASFTRPQLTALLTSKRNIHVAAIHALGRQARIAPIEQVAMATREPTYMWGLEKIGVPEQRRSFPQLDGGGVRVGIIDTGIESTHRDLAGRTQKFRNFLKAGGDEPFDDNGHGTHVAGTIVAGVHTGIYLGVAPKADLVVAKAFSERGSGEDEHLLLALQWMADPDGDPQTADAVKVINNSWNFSDASGNKEPGDDPFCIAIERLTALGVSVVFSAGNFGPNAGSVTAPASCPQALTVGATDNTDRVADSSARGPALWRESRVAKPDLVAPGVKILSTYPGMYMTLSGTSMAVPHVVGAIAILTQANPALTPHELQQLLTRTARDLDVPGWDAAAGFGRLDLPAALRGLPFVSK